MSKKGCIALLPLVLPGLALAQSQWVLEQNTLIYHVSHPLHQTDGVSHAARGKGVCHDAQCDFLVAVPVKTFDSGGDFILDRHGEEGGRIDFEVSQGCGNGSGDADLVPLPG